MHCQGPILNHYDYLPILGQSTRNLVIEGVMFNQVCDNQELDIFKI